jgi:hypothetical protein
MPAAWREIRAWQRSRTSAGQRVGERWSLTRRYRRFESARATQPTPGRTAPSGRWRPFGSRNTGAICSRRRPRIPSTSASTRLGRTGSGPCRPLHRPAPARLAPGAGQPASLRTRCAHRRRHPLTATADAAGITDPAGHRCSAPGRMEANGLPVCGILALPSCSRVAGPAASTSHHPGQVLANSSGSSTNRMRSWRSTHIRQDRRSAPWRPRCVLPCRGGSWLGGTVLRQLTAWLTARLTAALATVR